MILEYKNLKDVKISGTGGGTHTIIGEPTSDAEESFEHGRSIAIEGFTTQELIDELCKRSVKMEVEGVSNNKAPPYPGSAAWWARRENVGVL